MAFMPKPHAVQVFSHEQVDTNKKKAAAKPAAATATQVPQFEPMLGCSLKSGTYSKRDILSALSQPLCVKSTNGQKTYKVVSYDFTYAEQGIFEDSLGVPTRMIDYIYEECRGDSVKVRWQKALVDRLIKMDTLKFTQIVLLYEGKATKIKDNVVVVVK
ncbi:MAG: hypothetical protein RL660_788 [Bacteroidota bacterium]|jgi:hypothetical protein